MAILFSDQYDYIECKCGCKVLSEENLYTYKKENGRNGEMIKRTLVDTVLKCSKCKEILNYVLDAKAVITT